MKYNFNKFQRIQTTILGELKVTFKRDPELPPDPKNVNFFLACEKVYILWIQP